MSKRFIAIVAMVCAVIISLSVIGGFYILSQSLNKEADVDSILKIDTSKEVMNEQELAIYLGLTTANIEDILKKDTFVRQQMGDGLVDTYQFLPYYQATSGQKIFYKQEVNQWLSYQSKKLKS